MSGIGKIFVVLNLVFSLVIVGAAAAYLSKADELKQQLDDLQTRFDNEQENWKNERSDLTRQRNELQADNAKKQNTIQDSELEISNLNDQLKSEKVDNQQLRDDVTKINSSLKNLETHINDLTSRNNELVDQNAEKRNEALDAKDKQIKAEENLQRVQGELQRAMEQIESLEARVTALDEEKVHLSNILSVAQSQGFDISSAVATPEISAFVEEVNNDLGFVILSVGSDDKVQKGYNFSVYRGNAYLGEVKVDQVYPDRCSATIEVLVEGAQIKVNDKATTLL
jgi:peptidoglycan hydrolase CwlO-like protein